MIIVNQQICKPTFLPVDFASFALEDFRTLEIEGVVLDGLTLHHILFGQHFVGKVVVLLKTYRIKNDILLQE